MFSINGKLGLDGLTYIYRCEVGKSLGRVLDYIDQSGKSMQKLQYIVRFIVGGIHEEMKFMNERGQHGWMAFHLVHCEGGTEIYMYRPIPDDFEEDECPLLKKTN